MRRLLGRTGLAAAVTLAALGPAATLARGYAVVQAGRTVVRSTADAPADTPLRIRVADGALLATSAGPELA